MVQRSDLIIRGKVISTESQWKEDSRGRHIYTSVTVIILDKIKGNIKDDAFVFEVVGGIVDDIGEVVSDTPAFEVDEDAILFLAGDPLAIQHGINGRIPIYDGRVYLDGSEAAADSFIQNLKILGQNPNAPTSLEGKYPAPTERGEDAQCYIYEGYKWFGTSPTVCYYINENTFDCSEEGAAVQRGANTWNDVGADFTFQYCGSCSSTSKGMNGTNCIMWGTTSGSLATSWRWYYVGTNEIFECDIVFHDGHTWSTDADTPPGEYDVESVAVHELGHWLHLADLYDLEDRDKVMYGSLSSGDEVRTLHSCDIDGICYIYGCFCSITVTSPTGSSNWATGTSHTIMWDSSNNPGSYVKIQLYKGSSLIQTITSSTNDDGLYSWTPSTSLVDDSDYRIKITATLDSSCYDYSSYFAIYSTCSINVTSPDRDFWEMGEVYDINWVSEDTSGNVKIDLYKGGSLDHVIALSTPDSGTGSYAWSVPVDGSLTSDCDYRIKVTDVSNSSCNGYSAYFCIALGAPVLHAEPNISPGLSNTISWDAVPNANWYYAECANDADFANTVIGSGWISDTNCIFTGLNLEHKYWYRVKAAPRIESWSQTSQAEFQTDTLVDARATNDGDVVLTGGPVTPVVDTVGGTVTNFTTVDGYFNGFFVTKSTVLTQIEIFLSISTSTSIEFVVYEGGALFDNPYNRIHSSTLASSGTGTKFYGSGPISVTLQAGRHYMFGNTSSGSVTQYFNSSSSLSSFANHAGYGTCTGFPSPDILPVIYNAAYTMYHRYTTDDSTDYASSGSVVSSVIELPASGNWGWDVVDLNATMPENTYLTIDVLNGLDDSVILADVNSSTDINRITAMELKLRANLSTDDPTNTPALHDWTVSYAGPCESSWSDVESSLQCDTLCDFDNNNEINFADLTILAGQWQQAPGSPSADIAPEVPDNFVDYLDLAVFVEKWLFDITCTVQN
ncbi:MAG: Ser-Thr-rich GPI-anchored membrane family protein [Planctomycetota bacterium]